MAPFQVPHNWALFQSTKNIGGPTEFVKFELKHEVGCLFHKVIDFFVEDYAVLKIYSNGVFHLIHQNAWKNMTTIIMING